MASFSPWGSRSGTPRQGASTEDGRVASSIPGSKRGVDHAVSSTHKLSKKHYPPDCPPLVVRWYHAIDVPKRKPSVLTTLDPDKPAAVAKKFITFSEADSRAVEAAFQKLADQDDARGPARLLQGADCENVNDPPGLKHQEIGARKDAGRDVLSAPSVKVPVNEDYLFDVHVEARELTPAYWLGPIYDVRRGTWFYAESPPKPCDENLATQLEEGYLKVEPWKFAIARGRSSSHARSISNSQGRNEASATPIHQQSRPSTPKAAPDDQKHTVVEGEAESAVDDQTSIPPARTFRLFGAHMNSVVTYEDSRTAYVVTDDLLSRMSSTVYERFAGGGHFGGMKVLRGYSPETKKSETNSPRPMSSANESNSKSRPDPSETRESIAESSSRGEVHRQALERKMSDLVTSLKLEEEEEQVRRLDEKEIRDDYNEDATDEQGREIEHLILVTHGIGQRLGLRLENINFIHDVNTLRKTMKAVYGNSTDLQALNGEIDKSTKNCRVQVLPICWRHLLDFPKRSLQHNREKHDLGSSDPEQDVEYPSLDDITVQGVPAIRNLIMDLGLDILLYQSPVYKAHITKIVLEECNRIYKLFKARNPAFQGKVSLLGYSLGSAIMFDILCNQKLDSEFSSSTIKLRHRKTPPNLQLDFEVEDFYAIGSPIGLFQMLKGRTIAARHTPNVKVAQTPFTGPLTDPFSTEYTEIFTSSPKCRQLFNIFHPTDPISYRLEPLISTAMTQMDPQPMPYTKKGIFGAPAGQGLTGIGTRVGQSVSGLWSSFSSGLASNFLNLSLGLSSDDANRLANPLPPTSAAKNGPEAKSLEAMSTTTEVTSAPLTVEDVKRLLAQESQSLKQGESGQHPPTLLNASLETLYSGFQKQRSTVSEGERSIEDGKFRQEIDRVRKEDDKVLALNRNGRVDYSIQEGAFDISLLASLASHLSYWSDEDVSHFMISQLLSGSRVVRGTRATDPKGRL